MKNLRKITTMLIIVSIIISLCTFVNAAGGTQATISEGSKSGNVVTFTITVPEGTGLRGDATNDGNVNTIDLSAITEVNLGSKPLSEINKVNADIDGNGSVETSDVSRFGSEIIIANNYQPVTLTGTLAAKSTLVKNTDGNGGLQKVNSTTYKVEVKVPENENGTIGIKVRKEAFKYTQKDASAELTKEFTVTATPTKSYDKTIKIADGVQAKNIITFKVTLPKESGLLGDANDDGKVTEEDAKLVSNYNTNPTGVKNINLLNADADQTSGSKGIVELADVTRINKMLNEKAVTLTGTLAANSKYDFIKGTDGTYSIVVTVPTDKEGTIGVTLNKGVIIFGDHTTNDAVSSKEFKVTLDSLKGSGTNKTDETAKDANAKYSKLPAAGKETIIVSLVLGIIIIAVVMFKKYRNIDR